MWLVICHRMQGYACPLGLDARRVVYYYGKDRMDVRELLTRWRKRVALSVADGGRSSSNGSRVKTKMPPGYVPLPVDGDRGFDKLRAMQDSDEEAAEDEEEIFGYEVGHRIHGSHAPFRGQLFDLEQASSDTVVMLS